MEAAFVGGIISRLAEYLVDPIIKALKIQGRYLFCVNSIVNDLNEKERQLMSSQHRLQREVFTARNNTEIIEEDVNDWLTAVSNSLEVAQELKAKLEENKTCLHGWCLNCVGRYQLGRKAAKKTKHMLELQDAGNFTRVSHPAPLPGIEFSAPKDFELFQSSKIAFGQIIDALRDGKTNLVGLYAMGGAGKTTLATAVGVKVKEEGTFDEVVTVVVSQTPNFKDIQGKLASQLGMKKLEEEDEEERAKRLSLRFKDNKKKILVILDDVWKDFDLKYKLGIAIDEDKNNCKIVLTSRKRDVCISMGCQLPIQLKLLTENEGLDLLKRRAGIVGDAVTLNDLAEEIAKECRGLPLAIATIGIALKGKDVDEWTLVSRKLKSSKLVEVNNAFDVDKDVYAVLKLSYDYLKGEETKFCFLLCSLFPEDYRISLEELVLYGMGRGGLFSDANSIEEARSQLRVTLNNLKASCLLLDAGGDCVKMHDVVRDVALWIASKGENVFMSKAGMTLSDWSREKGWERYIAICSVGNQKGKVPVDLVCPKLEILLLFGSWGNKRLEVSDEFFTEMKALKVLSLSFMGLSIKLLQFLTNLKTLVLKDCDLKDISFLGKLNRLEFLRFGWCTSFDELPEELGELRELRSLDLELLFGSVTTIHSNVIKRFSQLEELYLRDINILWDVEGTNVGRRNATLFELNSLTCLNVLFLCIRDEFIPKDFAFPKLPSYSIGVNCEPYRQSYARTLHISNIDATLFIAFKALYETLEYLVLDNARGCQNIIPNVDQGGLNKLESLELEGCDELEYVLDMTGAQLPMPTKAVSKLVKLFLRHLKKLREICYGESLPREFLQKLETLRVCDCPDICRLFPTILLLRLHELKEVEISGCDRLQEVFQLEGLCLMEKENHVLLPNLAKIDLAELGELKRIWRGPSNVNLRSLTCLVICSCWTLECVLPINIARSLVQLEKLSIVNAPGLKQLFYLDHGRAVEAGEEIVLPKLREVILDGLKNLISFYPKNYYSTWPALEVLRIRDCPNLMSMVVASIRKIPIEKLRVLEMVDCAPRLSKGILACLKDGSKNLEELCIRNHRAKMEFKVDRLVTSINRERHLPSFSALKDLKLESLEESDGLYTISMQILTLQNLTELYITGDAQKSRHLFSIPLAQNLLQLEKLAIRHCEELEQIVVEGVEEDQKSLKESIFFPNLRDIDVEGCHQLKHLFSLTLAQNLLKVQNLSIKGCEELEQIIVEGDEEDQKLLKESILFPNLRDIDVRGCHKLKHLFSLTLAQNLLEVQKLSIKGCGELEQIIVEGDEEDQKLLKESILFPNLRDIDVRGCRKLKHLFPITIVRGFQLLEGIIVVDNYELREVFGHNESYIMDDREIRMHELRTLHLKKLPLLTNFCNADYHFIFSFLLSLEVEGCRKIASRFSVAEDKSVHVEAKAPPNEGENDIISYNYNRRRGDRTITTVCREENDNSNQA